MPSYELEPFTPYPAVRVVVATDFILPAQLKLLFWVIDPEQQVVYSEPTSDQTQQVVSDNFFELAYPRLDFLWQHSCFEIFVGVRNRTSYREINLSPFAYWNCYQFDAHRQPDTMPPVSANDIQLINLSFEQQKLHATIDLQDFLQQQQCKLQDLTIGLSSVIKVKNERALYFALKHSAPSADFHRQADWTLRL